MKKTYTEVCDRIRTPIITVFEDGYKVSVVGDQEQKLRILEESGWTLEEFQAAEAADLAETEALLQSL